LGPVLLPEAIRHDLPAHTWLSFHPGLLDDEKGSLRLLEERLLREARIVGGDGSQSVRRGLRAGHRRRSPGEKIALHGVDRRLVAMTPLPGRRGRWSTEPGRSSPATTAPAGPAQAQNDQKQDDTHDQDGTHGRAATAATEEEEASSAQSPAPTAATAASTSAAVETLAATGS
jgi:hypothetical protein